MCATSEYFGFFTDARCEPEYGDEEWRAGTQSDDRERGQVWYRERERRRVSLCWLTCGCCVYLMRDAAAGLGTGSASTAERRKIDSIGGTGRAAPSLYHGARSLNSYIPVYIYTHTYWYMYIQYTQVCIVYV